MPKHRKCKLSVSRVGLKICKVDFLVIYFNCMNDRLIPRVVFFSKKQYVIITIHFFVLYLTFHVCEINNNCHSVLRFSIKSLL